MNIGRETVVDHSGGHMWHTYQKNSGKTKQENAGGNFWTPTANFDHGGQPLWHSERGEAEQYRLGNRGGLMGGAYDAHPPKK